MQPWHWGSSVLRGVAAVWGWQQLPGLFVPWKTGVVQLPGPARIPVGRREEQTPLQMGPSNSENWALLFLQALVNQALAL